MYTYRRGYVSNISSRLHEALVIVVALSVAGGLVWVENLLCSFEFCSRYMPYLVRKIFQIYFGRKFSVATK